MQTPYPLYSAGGTPRELGRQHGEQAGVLVREFLALLQASLKLSSAEMEARALRFRPLFEKFCPHLVEEIAGLAEGAGISSAQALALQLRGEIGQLADGGCTTFVIAAQGTAARETLIGQNSDTAAEIERVGYVLRLEPDDGPKILMWTFGGMLGYHGINSRGLGHFANALGGGPEWKFALSHYPVKRLMLECRDLESVMDVLESVPVCSNGNYVICDGSGRITDVELTSDGPLVVDEHPGGFIAHSNHFLCAPHACAVNYDKSLPDSFPRLARMQQLISEKFGSITVEDLKSFLSDHAGHPVGICRHPHEGPGNSEWNAILPASGKTAASLIAEPARGLLHIARGNPCERQFATYRL